MEFKVGDVVLSHRKGDGRTIFRIVDRTIQSFTGYPWGNTLGVEFINSFNEKHLFIKLENLSKLEKLIYEINLD